MRSRKLVDRSYSYENSRFDLIEELALVVNGLDVDATV